MKFQIPLFDKANVLIVGDVMLDRYWYGSTLRISPEAPVPVVHVKEMNERPGGAGNVALNIRALGSQVKLIGLCGEDEAANTLENKLIAAGIQCLIQRDPNKPTITKLRVLSQNQQLIRMDFEEEFCQATHRPLLKASIAELNNINLLILSDYGKGSLGDCRDLIQAARQRNIPVLVDPKGNDFSIYQGATLLTPNLKEFEAIVGSCTTESELIHKGITLLKSLELDALLITRGGKGMTLLRENEAEMHLPAKSCEVYDVTGAGDTVIAVLGAALAAGADLPMAVAIANRAAGIVVAKLGAATVSVPELRRSIQKDQNTDTGAMTEEQVLIAVEDARAHGEKIVMTNGCFDILHAGHVSYLENAKSLGDRLIVAVNDDHSVAKLKGPNRPVNTLARRMAVLAGLAAVDWVVSFSEDTPARLIEAVLPDVLVKGGDYKPKDIAGSQAVLAHGGEVKILNFVDGCSTTAMLKRINDTVEVEIDM